MSEKLNVTPEASKIIGHLRKAHGTIVFYQDRGCATGSSLICYQPKDFLLGHNDVLLGKVEDCDFYLSKGKFSDWKDASLTLDIVKGQSSGFSLEVPMGVRFITKASF